MTTELNRHLRLDRSFSAKREVEFSDNRLTKKTLEKLANVFEVSVNGLLKNASNYFGNSLHPSFLETHF